MLLESIEIPVVWWASTTLAPRLVVESSVMCIIGILSELVRAWDRDEDRDLCIIIAFSYHYTIIDALSSPMDTGNDKRYEDENDYSNHSTNAYTDNFIH